jgi:hypothetical protein
MLLSLAGYGVHFCRDYIERNGRAIPWFEYLNDEFTGGIQILIFRRWLIMAGPLEHN